MAKLLPAFQPTFLICAVFQGRVGRRLHSLRPGRSGQKKKKKEILTIDGVALKSAQKVGLLSKGDQGESIMGSVDSASPVTKRNSLSVPARNA